MGLIRASVRNPVAANMLMILILGGGALAAFLTPRELFPEFSVDYVTVTVPYLGASPSDVEEGICLKIEDQLGGMEGVEEISSQSNEGTGMVALKIRTDADTREVLEKVRSEIDKIDFPVEAEDPSVVEITLRRHVIHVAIAGDASEHTLKALGEEVRDELSDLPQISQVTVAGVREYEISVEVSEEALRRHRLTMARIAQIIRDSSFDLPAGRVKTKSAEFAIRVVGQRYRAAEFRDIPVLYQPDGTVIKLGQIATVRDGFEDQDIGGRFNGKPAALVSVFKTADEDTIEIADAVREYIDRKKGEMPEGITLEPWADMSKLISDRLDLLIRNARQGLALVFLVLWLFLGFRLSFWVAMGIPVSVFGSLLVLNMIGMTVNMMSMFAMIMALGLIVDDAIVVGENIYQQVERGVPVATAAVEGTRQVFLPVLGAVLTTLLAFMPLMLIPGIMGRFIVLLPITVIAALSFSLIECVIILPPHLAQSLRHTAERGDRPGRWARWTRSARRRIDAAIQGFIDRLYLPLFRLARRYRYVTTALLLAILALMVGAVRAQWIGFTTFPKIDSDTIVAKITLPTGTPMDRTTAVAQQISAAAEKLNEQYQVPEGKAVLRAYTLLGQQTLANAAGVRGSHIAEVIVELMPAEQRGIPAQTLIDKWRGNTGVVPDALAMTFGALQGGPGGKSIEVRLLAREIDRIKPAAETLKRKLATYRGVKDIEDDALPGKMEMKVRLKKGAHALGVDLRSLAVPLRSAFYGNESLKLQRGRDEIKVMVRYPASQRKSLGNVENLRVRTSSGDQIPFNEVAEVEMKRGYTTLRRIERDSVVTVSADVDADVGNAEEILSALEAAGFFKALEKDHPGVRADLHGQRKQMFDSLKALLVWFPVALLGIYTILAGIFRSYFQPVIIMVAIPFGLVGAVIGHWVLGYDLTLLSMFGMVALTGIVVNDSLVLIDLVNRNIRDGRGVVESIEAGAKGRFRPIILTTATTVLGMSPVLAEQSFQAQYLKPMVVSIAFGLSFATLLTLIVVPCLYLIGNDVRRGIAWLKTGTLPAPEEVIKRDIRPEEWREE